MPEIKFGIKSLNKPIPARTTRNLSIAAFVFSTLNTWMATAAFIPASLSSVLQGCTGLGATICLGLIPFFGVDTTQKTVPIGEVQSMEVEKKD